LYSLRHTFATRFYQATKDIDKLARILGHGSLATVRRYVNPTQDDLRAAMQAFEQAALAPPVDMPFPPNHMVTGQAPPKVHRTCPAGRGPLLQAAQKKPEALGVDPDTGQSVYLKAGRYGPYVQIGDASNGEKPETASLLPNMQPDQVNLEVALKLLPHALGQHPDDGAPVIAANGRFGPYVKWGKEVRSIPAGSSPLDITLEQALELLKHPGGQRPAPRLEKLKELGPHPISDLPIVILSGRYGPYVTDGKTNASLPRGTMPEKVSINDAISLLDARATRESHTQ
jgi:topoisomerase IA-like protein